MRKNIQVIARCVCAFIVIVIGSYVIVAQNAFNGTWKANDYSNWNKKSKNKADDWEKRKDPNKVYLRFSYKNAKGGDNDQGSSFAYDELQGLTKKQVESADSNVNFRLAREAGTIEGEGIFQNGEGSGTFRFAANQNFISSMQNLGFKIDDNDLFAATTLDVTTSFARDVLSMGFENVDFNDVFKAKIFNITPQYAAEMKAIGFDKLKLEDLVKTRIFKIDANYAREVREMGFANKSIEDLVKLRIFEVTPEFLNELKGEGLSDLSSEDVVKLKIFKIDAEFIRKARSENVPINVAALVSKRIGVWSGK